MHQNSWQLGLYPGGPYIVPPDSLAGGEGTYYPLQRTLPPLSSSGFVLQGSGSLSNPNPNSNTKSLTQSRIYLS